MNRRARHILILSFFVAFLVIAPLLLLYTSGYRYNTKKHLIEKTGSISIESEPRGAEVRVDGSVLDRTTPVNVPRLLPETYTIEVLAEGYIPWKKRLTVESGRTTFAKDIALLPESLPRLSFTVDATASTWQEDGSSVVLAIRDEGWLEIAVVTFGSRGPSVTVLDRFPSDTFRDALFSWSPDGRTVSATLLSPEDDVLLFFYDTEETRATIGVHDTLADITFTSPEWSGDVAAVLAAGGAYSIDVAEDEISPLVIAAQLTGIALVDDVIWTLRTSTEGTMLERRSDDGTEVETVAVLTRPHSFVVATQGMLMLADERRGTGVLIDPVTGTLRETSAYTETAPHPEKASILLLCGAFELATYDSALNDGPRVITRSSEPLNDCAWHPSAQHAFYSTTEHVYAIDLDDRDLRDTHLIADFDAAASLAIDQENNLLRFIGSIGSQKGIFDRPL